MSIHVRSIRTALLAASVALAAFGGRAEAQIVAQAQGSSHWTIDESVFAVEVNNRTLSFNATRYADGRVLGAFEYIQVAEGVSYRFTGRVTCISIYDGNRAKVGGIIEVSNDPTIPVGTFGWFQAIDRGDGAGALPDQSTIMGFGDEAANEAFCASPNLPRRIFDVQGNIQVR